MNFLVTAFLFFCTIVMLYWGAKTICVLIEIDRRLRRQKKQISEILKEDIKQWH